MSKKPQPQVPAKVEPNSPQNSLSNDLKIELDRSIGPIVSQTQRGEIITRVMQVLYQEKFSGPIAHPRHLKAYEEIVPGSADRIIHMAEKAQDHNAEMDRTIVSGELEDQKRGMRYGLVALLIILACAAFFGYQGEEIITGLFLGTAVLGSIPIFVMGRNGNGKTS